MNKHKPDMNKKIIRNTQKLYYHMAVSLTLKNMRPNFPDRTALQSPSRVFSS
ncbi:hypothetical protein LguiA_005506 [Lonicera macranthoides]